MMAEEVEFTDSPDEAMILVYKSKTPYQRLEIAFALWAFARSLIKSGLRTRHQEWSERELEEETARGMLHPAD
jgi:hypothetical protein